MAEQEEPPKYTLMPIAPDCDRCGGRKEKMIRNIPERHNYEDCLSSLHKRLDYLEGAVGALLLVTGLVRREDGGDPPPGPAGSIPS